MVSLIQAIILSVIQGITEWFPISSSGHLFLINNFFGLETTNYNIFLHLGSILALLVILRKEIKELLKFDKKSLKYIFYLFIATIPAAIFGFFFRNYVINLFYLGIFFIFSGIIIYSTKFFSEKKYNITLMDSFFIGLFQSIAIFPGISRSGMTISSALFRGLNKNESIKFSFLLSIPIVLGASLLEFEKFTMDINYNILFISLAITFLVSLFTIKTAIRILNSDKFYLFGIYDVLLGIVVLIWSFI